MKPTKPIGIQLYSVRDHLAEDFEGTLEKVAAIGYDAVEFAGDYGGKTAEEVRAICDRLGLKAISTHTNYSILKNDLDATIAYHKTLGAEYIAIPWAGKEDSAGGANFDNALADYEKIGKKLKENGIALLYHNHDFEFVDYKGTCGYDYMFEAVPAAYLNPEMDVCWVRVAGNDPAAYIRKYAGRIKVLHLKDFVMGKNAQATDLYALIDDSGKDDAKIEGSKEDGFDFRPIGYGQQNIPAIIEAAEEVGVEYYIVEQDRSSQCDSLESARLSYEYLTQKIK